MTIGAGKMNAGNSLRYVSIRRDMSAEIESQAWSFFMSSGGISVPATLGSGQLFADLYRSHRTPSGIKSARSAINRPSRYTIAVISRFCTAGEHRQRRDPFDP
jgi:hypothetical protein